MAVGQEASLIVDAGIYLLSAVIAVPIFTRLKLGSILGYLAAGAIVGPSGLGLIAQSENVAHLAELGVVILLFIVGLELKPARLWLLRRMIFGLGLLQVLVTGLALAAILYVWQFDLVAAVIAGLALALSSTALSLQIMQDNGDLARHQGTTALSILLLQDIAFVPILAAMPLLAGKTSATPGWLSAGEALVVIVALIVGARYLLNPVFLMIAKSRATEVFSAAALLLVIGVALIMQSVGLSMALGAFIAGVMMAESEYRHQLKADLEPFRGLLLGLFFIAVGMSLDRSVLMQSWPVLIVGALILMAVKAAIIYFLCRRFGSTAEQSGRIAATLPQGGEFAFVLFSAAASHTLLAKAQADLLTAMVILSMAITPLGRYLYDRIAKHRQPSEPADIGPVAEPSGVETANPVILVGYGRFGESVAALLAAGDVSFTAIDNNPDSIRRARKFGAKVYFGNATHIDMLAAAGAAHAKMIIICIDDRDASQQAITHIRRTFPDVEVLTRAVDRDHAQHLLNADADYVVRDTFESSLALARESLLRLGVEDERINQLSAQIRQEDYQQLLARSAAPAPQNQRKKAM